MPSFYTDVDVDVDDFVGSCSKSEIAELIECLVDDGHLIGHPVEVATNATVEDEKWNDEVAKLFNNRWKLTVEDEQKILSVTQRLV